MLVKDVMTADVIVVSPFDSVQHAAALMQQHDFGGLPVGQHEQLLGIVTDRDIAVRAVARGRIPTQTLVNEVMSAPIAYVRDDQSLEEAARLMAQGRVRRLPVVDQEKRLVGIVSLGDLALRSARPAGEALGSISEPLQPITGARS